MFLDIGIVFLLFPLLANLLLHASVNDGLTIDAVNTMLSTVKEVEGFFNANLVVNFEIY